MIKRFRIKKWWSPFKRRYIITVKLETENKEQINRYYDIMVEGLTKITDKINKVLSVKQGGR